MLKILLYAYSVGVRSSRQIAAKLETDVAFRVLGSGLFPDSVPSTSSGEGRKEGRTGSSEGRDPPRERPELREHPKGKPRPKDQENFTDPDSRVMDAGGGNFQQSYNTQIAVDAQEQIVVAAWVGQCAADSHHLIPVLEEVHKNTNRRPDRVLADTGYRSEDNLRHLKEQGIHGYVAEPVFGWIKQVLGFRQFSLRGLAKVRAEWELACAAVNLRRMGARLEWR